MQLKIGERFKSYENAFSHQLPPRMPVIVRVDGRAFHTLTKREPTIEKPFCPYFSAAMETTTAALIEETHAIMGYQQSDEISLLLLNDRKHETQAYFDNECAKIISITASVASVAFSQYMSELLKKRITAHFDSRAFIIPPNEIENYFIWRQLDAIRNAKNGWTECTLGKEIGLGTARKVLHGKSASERVEYVEANTTHKFDEIPLHFVYGREITLHMRKALGKTADCMLTSQPAPYYIDHKEHVAETLQHYYEKAE